MYDTTDCHGYIRSEVVEWIKRNKDNRLENNSFIMNYLVETSVEDYCGEMSKNGIWGDHLSLMVFSFFFSLLS